MAAGACKPAAGLMRALTALRWYLLNRCQPIGVEAGLVGVHAQAFHAFFVLVDLGYGFAQRAAVAIKLMHLRQA